MEKSFIISKDSKYFQDYNKHIERTKHQRTFVNKFFEENGIEANEYRVSGNGLVNKPFEEYGKANIILSINPTENDLNRFNRILSKTSSKDGLRSFRRNSALSKEFAKMCVDEKLIINLRKPYPREYFKSLGYDRYSFQQFIHNDTFYLKVDSEHLKEDDIPEGFVEIKLSEYYRVIEETKNKQNEK